MRNEKVVLEAVIKLIGYMASCQVDIFLKETLIIDIESE